MTDQTQFAFVSLLNSVRPIPKILDLVSGRYYTNGTHSTKQRLQNNDLFDIFHCTKNKVWSQHPELYSQLGELVSLIICSKDVKNYDLCSSVKHQLQTLAYCLTKMCTRNEYDDTAYNAYQIFFETKFLDDEDYLAFKEMMLYWNVRGTEDENRFWN